MIELNPEIEDRLKHRASAKGFEVGEYVKKLIEEDSEKLRSIDEIFAPFRENVEKSGVSENELNDIFTQARKEVFAERKAEQTPCDA
ncbi:MAG: hypothetical protein LUM44_15325 [Pyrinomonadaceae bacterium]|nr:hypothetical protein [Pyrinomonadaceae bacterium]